ncbi:FabD/lysophospholipase-like protein [Dissoconium aciculare CBS 342.82]|uniref:Lysophospholipase n=1 Tax=Dissoconium aciculare CBS 342.82 TaxID=1314786 RepID=A0A6J3MDV4_9PEZI|nr:FabD/lysophospholipase-like protein [Dissoconium aciculare CBS 342.82]KAF1826190.1 FabD/lysophospholipase-like protein [Dissoconium aciculare CBS 342.82]
MAHQVAVFALLCALCNAISIPAPFEISSRATSESYAPYKVQCPFIKPQVRSANSLGPRESAYVAQRQTLADQNLKSWLDKALSGSTATGGCKLPRVALALSGGGPKAGLTTAGVVQAFDSRDTSNGVGGLLQGMTYVSALSGGSLTLSGMMVNNFARISDLKTKLYNINYQNPYQLPIVNADQIKADMNSKFNAGFRATTVDAYGRAISYDFIGGTQGGNALTWSNVTTLSAFKSHEIPYPIITLTDTNVPQGECFPSPTNPIWEVGPYEFGSWDQDVNAFYPTEYLGTPAPTRWFFWQKSSCINGFDNAGLITGISSDTFVSGNTCARNGTVKPLAGLGQVVNDVFGGPNLESSPYGIVPNPFYHSKRAGKVNERQDLYMQDGGYTGQGIPIFPFIQPERQVDVIFVIDATSSAPTNVTNGASIYRTYVSANSTGLTAMPVIPTPEVFAAQNLSSRAQFFGCHDKKVSTLIYVPNTYESGISSSSYFFTPEQLEYTFQGGVSMATQANNTEWPACVACAVLHKTSNNLPAVCNGCLDKYCWTG